MPFDYTTLARVRQTLALEVDETDDDTFLTNLLPIASRVIDSFCARQIVAETDTNKYDAVEDIEGMDLFLDEDLVSATTITNGDGTVLTSSDFVLLPSNQTPKYVIRLKSSSNEVWTYQDDPEEAIEVVGSWGYAAGTPDDIQQACIRLCVWMYKQRDVPFLEVGLSEGGFSPVIVSMPNDIKIMLHPFKKGRMA